jgi:hypothetical protein
VVAEKTVARRPNRLHGTRFVRRFTLLIFLCSGCFALSSALVRAEGLAPSKSRFYYKDASGKTESVRIIDHYLPVPIVHPFAQIDPRLDPTLRRAATIADERSNARSKARCWHYVKEALFASGAISSYPKTAYAWQAGEELVRNYGFKRLGMRDPYAAPVGAVLVYSHGSSGAGHVEIRTKTGFVSDYHSKNRCRYPLLAVYGKFSS